MKLNIFLFLVLLPNLIYSQIDYKEVFKKYSVNGSISIYDYNSQKWIFSDSIDSQIATLPASTFKILNTLIALECEIIKSEEDLIAWPGHTDTLLYGYRPDIYHDMTIQEAFKVSAVWVYLELSEKIGKTRYIDYLTRCNYGNVNIKNADLDFWNLGDFAVSPKNQVETLVKIYEEKLPFSKKSFEIMKRMMEDEKTDNYILYAKTGWTRKNGIDIGWWIGYVETKDNVYFFATRITKNQYDKNPDFGRCRKDITKLILKKLDIL